jgi:hypothetical protein
MTKQEKILLEVAEKHGLSIGVARHAFECIGRAAAGVIDDPEARLEDNLWDPEKLKTISIIGLGKFVPSKKRATYRNEKRKLANGKL